MTRLVTRDTSTRLSKQTVQVSELSGTLALRMFLIFAFAYLISYAMRSINAVIASELKHDLLLNAGQLGLLASAYFFSFALMQLPVGVLLDRFGPRRVNALLMLLAAAGCALFAVADSFLVLWLGRALIGIGVSACLMAAVQAYALYFKSHLQGTMSSCMLMAGSLGAILVTTPVHNALPILGWRGIFLLVAGACVLASAALWWGLPRLPFPGGQERLGDLFAGFKQVFVNQHFQRMAPLACLVQGGFMAFSGLWLGPWLTQVQGLSTADTAHALFGFSVVLLLGYLTTGLLSRVLSIRGQGVMPILVVSGLGSLLLMCFQVSTEGAFGVWGWWLYAFCSSGAIVTYAWCNEAFTKTLAGRSSAGLNLLIFVGAFIIQWGLGLGIDFFVALGQNQALAMRMALGVWTFLMLMSWLWFIRPGLSGSALRHRMEPV
jgi:predicted MFS family arabinose efflux permease